MPPPSLAGLTKSKLPGLASPAAPRPVPRKRRPPSFLEMEKQRTDYEGKVQTAHEQFLADVPLIKRVIPDPGPMPDFGRGGGMGKMIWLQQKQAHERSLKENAAWRAQREKEWRDVLSGKTEREQKKAFLAGAPSSLHRGPGGRVPPGVDPEEFDRKVAEARKQDLKERKAEYGRMLADPEAYAAEQARKPRDPIGFVAKAGIDLGSALGVPKRVSDDLRVISAGIIPGMAQSAKAGYGIFTGHPDQAEEMVNQMAAQYRQNYLAHGWKGALSYAAAHPVLAGLDASVLLAPAAKVGSIGALTRTFMEANAGMSAVQALRLAAKESKLPGYAALQGFKGGIPERVLVGRSHTSTAPRPTSKSPLGRVGQRGYDRLSKVLDVPAPYAIPGLRALGTSSRAAAADAKEARRIRARSEALMQVLQDPVAAFASKGGRARVRKLIGEAVPDKDAGAALVAALEAGTDPATALRERIGALNNVLEHGIMWDRKIDSPHRDTFIETLNERFDPDEVEQLTQLTDHIALAHDPKQPERWYAQHLAESSNMSASDFIRSGAAAAAQFQVRASHRKGLVETGRTRVVNRSDLDVEAELAAIRSERDVEAGAEPDPNFAPSAIYFKDKGGSEGVLLKTAQGWEHHNLETSHSTTLTDTEAADLLKNETEGKVWIGNEGYSGAFEVPVFYSPLQRAIEKLPGKGMKANSLKNALRKQGISNEEWRAMGLDLFFDLHALDGGEYARVSYEELNAFLADPLNAYNLGEIVRSSNASGVERALGEGTRWHEHGNRGLITRTPTEEHPYYELTMAMPSPLDRGYMPSGGAPRELNRYAGKGEIHWGERDVVVHIRFHVITDNEGKRAILIDEIQSDWSSQWRTRQAVPKDYPGTPKQYWLEKLEQINEEKRLLLERGQRHRELDQEILDAEDKLQQLLDEGDEQGARDQAEELDRLNEEQDAYADDQDKLNALNYQVRAVHDLVQMPRPPMGEAHLDAAARRMMRWAHEEGAERIIIVHPDVQAARNLAVKKLPHLGRAVDEISERKIDLSWPDMELFDRESERYRQWEQDMDAYKWWAGMLTPEEAKAFFRDPANLSETGKTFDKLYRGKLPSVFEQNMGEKGSMRRDIYMGHYGDEQGALQGEGGHWGLDLTDRPEHPMDGYVIEMTPRAHERAAIPMAQFQHQPNWNGLPRGATQFLADGKTAMRLFEGAGVDTVIHELAHIALPDMPQADRDILAAHFGGKIEEWGNQQHEAFARGFEGYLYSGKAPTPELQQAFAKIRLWIAAIWQRLKQDPDSFLTPEVNAVFERMVLPKDRSPLTIEQRNRVQTQIKELEDALENLGDPSEYEDALAAMRSMSQWAEDLGRESMLFGADRTPDPDTGISEYDEMSEMIDEMLHRRRFAYTNLLKSMGIIDPSDETTRAAGYFPNLSIWRVGGNAPIAPTKLAATSNVMGVAQPRPNALNMHRNQFVRFQTGELGMNPATMYDVLRLRYKHLTTQKLRQRLYDQGAPIKRYESIDDIDEGLIFIRDQRQDAAKMKLETRAALGLDEESYKALVERGMDPFGKLDESNWDAPQADLDAAAKERDDGAWWKGKDGETVPPPWMRDEDSVRTVPRYVAEKLFGEVFPSAPRGGWFGPTVNAFARMSLLYAPGPVPGSRYVARNFAQNAVLMGITHPLGMRRALYAVRRLGQDHPDIARLIDADSGSTRAEAALPEHYTAAQTGTQRFQRRVEAVQSGIGSKLSAAADTPFRRSAWIGYAERYGFHGPEGWRRLLTSNDPPVERTRRLISQSVRDDLIDFDSMSEKERRFASHYFFLYPFLRGSLKWPFMFAREYPFRAGLGAGLAAQTGTQREKEALAKTTSEAGRTKLSPGKRQYEFGWLDPVAPSAQTFEQIAALAKGLPKGDLQALMQILSPEYREGIRMLSGGTSKTEPFAQLLGTFAPGYNSFRKWERGGSLEDQLLRHFGLSTEITPSRLVLRKQAQADLADAWQWAQKEGGGGLDLAEVQKSARAYEKFEDLKQRIDFSQKDLGEGSLRKDDLSPAQVLEREQQKALALTAAIGEGFPEARQQMAAQMPRIRESSLAQLQAYNEQMQKIAFVQRNALINSWKKATGG